MKSPDGPDDPPEKTCPGCGAALAQEAVLCVSCGTVAKTGQKLAMPAHPAPPRGGPAMSLLPTKRWHYAAIVVVLIAINLAALLAVGRRRSGPTPQARPLPSAPVVPRPAPLPAPLPPPPGPAVQALPEPAPPKPAQPTGARVIDGPDEPVRVVGKRIVSVRDGVEMVFVPRGTLRMGSQDGVGRQDEHPQRTVTVSAFCIDKYEVTNAQYQQFVRGTHHPAPGHWADDRFPRGRDMHPVVNVSWQDAAAYAKWARKQLPTECQWERAARGDSARVFPWGNDWDWRGCVSVERLTWQCFTEPRRLDEWLRAWSASPAGAAATALGGLTEPVGSSPHDVSPFGCFDMAGNAAEWCGDRYDSGFYARAPSEDPLCTEGDGLSVRGGSWCSFSSGGPRCAARRNGGRDPAAPLGDAGFRCVLALDDEWLRQDMEAFHKGLPKPAEPAPIPETHLPEQTLAAALAQYAPAPAKGSLLVAQGGRYPDIASAMNAARSGQTVYVGPGVYRGEVLLKSGVRLQGAGPASTRLESEGGGRALRGEGATDVVVDGFTLAAAPTLVWLRASHVRLSHCVLQGPGGRGLAAERGSRVVLSDCIFMDLDDRGAVVADDSSARASRVVWSRCGRHGVEVVNRSQMSAARCIVAGHREAGAYVGRDARLRAVECTFRHNGGAGVLLRKAQADLGRCSAAANRGPGVAAAEGSRLTMAESIVARNESGLRVEAGSAATLSANALWGNVLGPVVGMDLAEGAAVLAEDPQFVDPVRGDLRLQPSSRCIGAGRFGRDLGAYAHLRDLLDQVRADSGQGRFDRVIAACDGASAKAQPPAAQAQIERERREAEWAKSAAGAIVAALRERLGEPLSIRRRVGRGALAKTTGTLTAVDPAGIELREPSGRLRKMKYDELATPDLVELGLGHMGATADAALRMAVYLLRTGSETEARRMLDRARAAGTPPAAVAEILR